MVFASGHWQLLCTGALVSPRVFLTASHCTSYAEANGWPVAVSFDSTDVENTTDIRPATSVTNPAYRTGVANDVSLLLLTAPVSDRSPMALAPVGYLDDLKASGAIKTMSFTNVGYGTQEKGKGQAEDFAFTGSDPPPPEGTRLRGRHLLRRLGWTDAVRQPRDCGREHGRRPLLVDEREHTR